MKHNIDKSKYYEKIVKDELEDCYKTLFSIDKGAAQKMSAIRFIANYLDDPLNVLKLQSIKKVQTRPDISALIEQVLEERSEHNFGVRKYLKADDIKQIYDSIEDLPSPVDFNETLVKENLMFFRAANKN